MLAVCADLARSLAQARMVMASSVMLAPLLQLASIEEAHATALEIYAECQLADDEGTTQSPQHPEHGGNGHEGAAEKAPAEYTPLTPEQYCEQRLPKTLARARRLIQDLVRQFAIIPASILVGLDRFTRQVLGMDAKSVLKAVMPPVLAEIETLKVDQIKPDEDLASEVEKTIMEGWRKFVFRE